MILGRPVGWRLDRNQPSILHAAIIPTRRVRDQIKIGTPHSGGAGGRVAVTTMGRYVMHGTEQGGPANALFPPDRAFTADAAVDPAFRMPAFFAVRRDNSGDFGASAFERSAMQENPTEAARAGRSVTLVGFWINALLILVKFLAGWFGRSQALLADAVHSASDLLTDGVTLLGIHVGRKEADDRHHFGHARLETLASALVGISLIATGVYIGVDAGLNIHEHSEYHPTGLALLGAGLSIACKEILYHYTVSVGKRIQSQLIVVNAWHHRSDALSSVAVFLGVLGTYVHPDWHILDAYAALLVSFFIVKVGLDAIRDSLREFTDTAPGPEVIDRIRHCICRTDGVLDMHDLRVRTAGGRYQMEVHIEVNEQLSVGEGHRIAKNVEGCLLDEIGDTDRVIVHVDPQKP